MVQRIDKELLRKRAEHNDGELSSLKEVTLHQYDIEKIENLDVYCRHLEILFLQNNQISKIENLNKLKELKYLQLALNNISKIENLEHCESLEKLDLTVNFVENPLDVVHLKNNEQLRELYLVGNPCTRKEGYREAVITLLPQLRMLDGHEITRSERLAAAQVFDQIQARFEKEASELHSSESPQDGQLPAQVGPPKAVTTETSSTAVNTLEETDINSAPADIPEETELERKRRHYQTEKTPHTPAARLEAARDLASMKNPPAPSKPAAKPAPILFAPDGRVLQKNQGKWSYRFVTTPSTITLHLELSRFLDTSLIDVHVERTWLRVLVKGKVLQLVLDEPVHTDDVICERSTVSGWLAVTMLRESAAEGTSAEGARRAEAQEREKAARMERIAKEKEKEKAKATAANLRKRPTAAFEPVAAVDISGIVDGANPPSQRAKAGIFNRTYSVAPAELPVGFEDDPDVPPLC
ncbi:Protein tilB [Geranomyces michiganensis]|nr:Protein tilB [Geranomyces michiganensis]